ncbi:hypothetical protein XIS1_750008 [Xenorhabdus innexi]|uniref:Uncharacterized protein n=1 Tax=Xenorhabdus innexi TaxID=290109 RepID=A0A1N6N0R2_9GAMM|nr:hypothetical protein XIS1_750008 [Xenorhabdus innexi]
MNKNVYQVPFLTPYIIKIKAGTFPQGKYPAGCFIQLTIVN